MNTFGLNDNEVIESRKKNGSNTLSKIKSDSILQLFIQSLGDPIIKILLVALGIKIFFLIKSVDIFETIGILSAIFISSFISSISEYGSQKSFIKMQEEASLIKVKAKRNNSVVEISIDDIVCNDIVILEQGDKIPADGIIIDGSVMVDESVLSGETKEIEKIVNSKVFRGTTVNDKKAIMLVTAVGNNTMYGQLNKELQEDSPESPLKFRLKKLALMISKIGYFGAFLVSFSYLFSKIVIDNHFNKDLIISTITNFPLMMNYIIYALTLVVTIIVVAVPEGLPMMITLVLSKNMKKMIKENVLVRKMTGIETAGNINILFTDKTGTLTNGKFEIVDICLGNNKKFNNLYEIKKYNDYYNILSNNIIYNSDCYYDNGSIIGGNITDRTLFSFFKKEKDNKVKIIKRKHFNSSNKYSMTTIDLNGKIDLIKGAKEIILPKCKYYYNEYGKVNKIKDISLLDKYSDNLAKCGIRVICVAQKEAFYDGLILVSLISIKDEIRENTKEGIELIKNAGIQVVMLTGDNINTAISIGKELDLINDSDIAITSNELHEKSEEELRSILPKLRIVARALPSDKTKLIKIAQNMGMIVGMTGDGVNDAPALKNADIGFSMGSGTEIAKEASDIVILDNNIKSISNAILYGRTIFKSIRKFIICQLSINLCAIGLSIIGTFIGIDTPVTVIQMLWINMVMDTLTGLAFAYEPPLKEYMNELPKNKEEPIINSYMFSEIFFTGIYSFLLCIFFLKSNIILNIYRNNYSYLMSAFFGLFIFIDIFNSLNARTERINIFANILKNKFYIIIVIFIIVMQLLMIYYGGNTFRTIGLNLKELEIMILLSSTVIPVDILRKIIIKRKKPN